jgi:hypothetical protein
VRNAVLGRTRSLMPLCLQEILSMFVEANSLPFMPQELLRHLRRIYPGISLQDSTLLKLLENLESSYLGLSISRPTRPVNGVSGLESRGIVFEGRRFYFRDQVRTKIVEILTGQNENLEIDVIRRLTLEREDFGTITVRECFDRRYGTYQVTIKGKTVELFPTEMVVLLNEMGKVFDSIVPASVPEVF